MINLFNKKPCIAKTDFYHSHKSYWHNKINYIKNFNDKSIFSGSFGAKAWAMHSPIQT